MSDTEIRDFLAGRHKLVLRLKSGKVVRGYMKSQSLARGKLYLTTAEGQDVAADVEKLKGVFFVREFEGDKRYFEKKLLDAEPDRKGLRVRIRFEDNETMEGVTENSLEILQSPGFYLWPADTGSNNLLVFVVKSALLGFKVIGLKV